MEQPAGGTSQNDSNNNAADNNGQQPHQQQQQQHHHHARHSSPSSVRRGPYTSTEEEEALRAMKRLIKSKETKKKNTKSKRKKNKSKKKKQSATSGGHQKRGRSRRRHGRDRTRPPSLFDGYYINEQTGEFEPEEMLDCDHHHHHPTTILATAQQQRSSTSTSHLSQSWTAPPRSEMSRRLDVRRTMLEDTFLCRRNVVVGSTTVGHNNSNNNKATDGVNITTSSKSSGRDRSYNVVQLLHERTLSGGRRHDGSVTTSLTGWSNNTGAAMTSTAATMEDGTPSSTTSTTTINPPLSTSRLLSGISASRVQAQSQRQTASRNGTNTVIMSQYTKDHSRTVHQHRRNRRQQQQILKVADPTPADDDDNNNHQTKNNIPIKRTRMRTKSTTRLPTNNPSIQRQLETYAEYISVNKYHSTYLNHLGGNYEYNMLTESKADQDEQSQQQRRQNIVYRRPVSDAMMGINDDHQSDNNDDSDVDMMGDSDSDSEVASEDGTSDSNEDDDDGRNSEGEDIEDEEDHPETMLVDDENSDDSDEDDEEDLIESQRIRQQQRRDPPTFRHNGQNLPITQRAISTISLAFSPDKTVMASTHGDHTIKLTCTKTGRILRSLEGHPRTPWTVKFHPTKPNIIASGCLGHQVRLWDWTATEPERQCLSFIRLEFAIISLSFHPSGQCLAIANGTRLHFWGDLQNHIGGDDNDNNDDDEPQGDVVAEETDVDPRTRHGLHRQPSAAATGETSNAHGGDGQQQPPRPRPRPRQVRALLTEVEQRHMLRCVHFPPDGRSLIVGGVNPTSSSSNDRSGNRGGISGGGMSFYLRLWDFDLDASAGRPSRRPTGSKTRRAISSPRTFVPRALLYNDGGFDVSPDGKTLCACAEYWLPDGVNSATELFGSESHLDESADEESYFDSDSSDNEESSESSPRKHDVPTTGPETLSSAGSASQSVASPPRPPLPQNVHSQSTTPSANVTDSASITMPPPPNQLPQAAGSVNASGTGGGLIPQTPPAMQPQQYSLSPPSPPGRRFAGGLGQGTAVPSVQQGISRPPSDSTNNDDDQPMHSTPPRNLSTTDHDDGTETASASTPTVEGPPAMGIPRRPTLSASDAANVSTAATSSSAAVAAAASSSTDHQNQTSTPVHRLQQQQQQLNAPPAPRRHRGIPSKTNTSSSSRSTRNNQQLDEKRPGRYVPHVVTISIDTSPYIEMVADDQDPNRPSSSSSSIAGTDTTLGGGDSKNNSSALPLRPKLQIPGRLSAAPSTVNGGGKADNPAFAFAAGGGGNGGNNTNDATTPLQRQLNYRRPRLGQLLEAFPLDGTKASAVTCVKFSPACDYLLIGYGVRDPVAEAETVGGQPYHPVAALYRCKGGMQHVSTMLSSDDDVNIARFHPLSGNGFVYGTKQGKVRVLGPRPWNYYHM